MRAKYIFGILLIVIFGAFAGHALMGSMTPYVGFAEARQASGSVQVNGYLVEDYKQEVSYNPETSELIFVMKDEEGSRARVRYEGGKPDNFMHAESVVVIGEFSGEEFVADNLLVQCPSRYEEEEAGEKAS